MNQHGEVATASIPALCIRDSQNEPGPRPNMFQISIVIKGPFRSNTMT